MIQKTERAQHREYRPASGRSLQASYFADSPRWDKLDVVQLIAVENLVPHPLNPRKATSRAAMDLLKSGIESAGGILTPLVVIPKTDDVERAYIVGGHRRHFAAKELGFTHVPCQLRRAPASDADLLRELIVLNEHHERPMPIDRAKSISEYIRLANCTQQAAAKALGIDGATVSKLLSLLQLPQEVQDLVNVGKISESMGFRLALHHNDPAFVLDLSTRATKESWTLKQLREFEHRHKARLPRSVSVRRARADAVVKSREVAGGAAQVLVRSLRGELSAREHALALAEALVKSTRHSTSSRRPDGSLTLQPERGHQTPRAEMPVSEGPPNHGSRLNLAVAGGATASVGSASSPIPDGLRVGVARALDALYIDGSPDWSQADRIQLVSLSQLCPHPKNPRTRASKNAFTELLAGIQSAGGIHTPLKIARGPSANQHYIIAGHRRFAAAKELKYDLVPCRLIPNQLTDLQTAQLLILDNELQEKPAPIDRARSIHSYLKMTSSTLAEGARALGLHEAYLGRLLALLTLPDDIQQAINQGRINEAAATALTRVTGGPDAQRAVAENVLRNQWTAKRIEAHISRQALNLGASKANDASGSEHLWRIGESSEIEVEVGTTRRGVSQHRVSVFLAEALTSVSANPAIRAEIQKTFGIEVNRKDKTVIVRGSAIDIDAERTRDLALVALGSVVPGFNPAFVALLRNAIGDSELHIKDGQALISSSLASVLQTRLSEDSLRAHDLLASGQSRLIAARAANERYDERLGTPLIHLLASWCASIQELSAEPDRALGGSDLNRHDVDLPDRTKASVLVESLITSLKKVRSALANGLIDLCEAEQALRELQTSTLPEVLLPDSDQRILNLRNASAVVFSFKRWASSEGLRIPEGSLPLRLFDRFLASRQVAVLRCSGGILKARIGRKQLSERCVPFAGTLGPRAAALVSVSAVINEYAANRVAVAQAIQSFRGS